VSAAKAKRQRPGELDGLVLAYLADHKDNGPLTATAIGKGIGRSAGAVANCLGRLVKDKKVSSWARSAWEVPTAGCASTGRRSAGASTAPTAAPPAGHGQQS
jgi:hypothetical protein